MFEQTFVQTGKTHTTWTVMTSFGVQILLLGFGVMIPLIWFDELPGATLSALITAPPPPPPPPPPPQAAPPKVVKVIPRQMDAGKLMQPKVVPKDIKMIQEDEAPSANMGVAGGVPGGVSGGALGGVLGGILGSVPTAAPPPKKAPPPPPPHPSIIPVGGRVQNAKLIRNPQPIYPQIAKSARISGTVELSAIIGEDGKIQQLTVVSGHPLLRQAALDAVKQWVYQPTLLNEQPVKVSTTIDVIFTLSQ
jgi:periplasmic protein TonB